MSRPVVALSQLREGRSVTRTLGAIAALTLVVGCSQDVTEPAPARPTATAKPLAGLVPAVPFGPTGPIGPVSVWDGHTVNIANVQPNSANNMVCLDIPWGEAFSGQVVNYFQCHTGTAQQFTITAWLHPTADSGSWAMIRPVSNSSVCLDMRGATTNGGEHLQLLACKAPNSAGVNSQIFRLPPAKLSGTALLLTTICPKAQPATGKLALELPLPLAASSFVQQGTLIPDSVRTRQLWMIKDVPSNNYFQSANGAGMTWVCR